MGTRFPHPVPMAEAGAVLDGNPRLIIDLRSPAEYAEDRVPGAVNVPLFDDLERALIGTLYARHSPAAAFEQGRATTRGKIGSFTTRLAELAGWHLPALDLAERVDRLTQAGIVELERELEPVRTETSAQAVVLYCWRGGLRSRAVIALLLELGFDEVVGIEGGYKAYRRCVRERIAAWQAPESFVLRGLTGVGKTLVLREVERLRPGWTLDLEAMAGHRSSILGMVGLQPASQKLFESRAAQRLARVSSGLCVVEGESRKVGDLVLPEPLWRAIDGGMPLEIVASTARRIRVLVEDYLADAANRTELLGQLPFIEDRLGPRWRGVLTAMLETGREEELVELLLERYYDPLYRHSERGRRYAARFDGEDPARAASAMVSWIEHTHAGLAPRAATRSVTRAGTAAL